MNSGRINRRITVEKILDNPTEDDYGEADLTDDGNWETYCKPWAEVQTKGGREFWKVDKVEADVSHLLRVPYDRLTKGITEQMRIKLNGRTLNIVAAFDPDEAHKIIEIQAKEPK